jgi:hypothetical protein
MDVQKPVMEHARQGATAAGFGGSVLDQSVSAIDMVAENLPHGHLAAAVHLEWTQPRIGPAIGP